MPPDQGAEGECCLGHKQGNERLVFAHPSEDCASGRKHTEEGQLARLPVHQATFSVPFGCVVDKVSNDVFRPNEDTHVRYPRLGRSSSPV